MRRLKLHSVPARIPPPKNRIPKTKNKPSMDNKSENPKKPEIHDYAATMPQGRRAGEASMGCFACAVIAGLVILITVIANNL